MADNPGNTQPKIGRPSIFYGWWIVAGGTSTQFFIALLWLQSYGVYALLLIQDFGWSKAAISGSFALGQVLYAVLSPIHGWLIDKAGPRALLRVGLVLFGLGLIALSQLQSLTGFYLAFCLISIGVGLGGFTTVMTAIVSWFRAHRATALSISQTGFSVGGLCIPITIYLIETLGWRTTAMGSGIFIIVVGLIIAEIFRPKSASARQKPPISDDQTTRFEHNFTTTQALRTSAFWLITTGHAVSLLIVSAVSVHLVTHLTENLSYSLAQAGLVVTLMTLCQLFGQLGGGFLGDRFSKQAICAICMLSHSLGLLLVALADNLFMVIAFALLHGTAWGVRGPLMVALRADYFGSLAFGKIIGISTTVVVVGMAIGPLVAGYFADLYGDYRIGFILLAGTVALGSACFWRLSPPKPSTNQQKPGIAKVHK